VTRVADPAELTESTSLGVSEWHVVTQEMVDRFADLTGDHQWLHTDARRAGEGPFGAPIAHGFLVLAMTTMLLSEIIRVDGASLVLNQGVGRTRILAPVRVGDRIRARAHVVSARQRPRGYWEGVFGIAVESTGEDVVLTTELTLLHQFG
jgi:acyl dehydratase